MEDSWVAIFFITKEYKDEHCLASEIDYAINMARKNKHFRIITLVLDEDSQVPALLQSYVYKYIVNDLEGLGAILKALPLKVGNIQFKPEVFRQKI